MTAGRREEYFVDYYSSSVPKLHLKVTASTKKGQFTGFNLSAKLCFDSHKLNFTGSFMAMACPTFCNSFSAKRIDQSQLNCPHRHPSHLVAMHSKQRLL